MKPAQRSPLAIVRERQRILRMATVQAVPRVQKISLGMTVVQKISVAQDRQMVITECRMTPSKMTVTTVDMTQSSPTVTAMTTVERRAVEMTIKSIQQNPVRLATDWRKIVKMA